MHTLQAHAFPIIHTLSALREFGYVLNITIFLSVIGTSCPSDETTEALAGETMGLFPFGGIRQHWHP